MVGKAVVGSPAAPITWPGCSCSVDFSSISSCLVGLKQSSQITLCSNPHTSSSQVLFFPLPGPGLGSGPAPKSAGLGCSHKSMWTALRPRVLGKGERWRRWLMKRVESCQTCLLPAKKHLILSGTEGMGSWWKHVPDVSGFYLISLCSWTSEQSVVRELCGRGGAAGFPGQGMGEETPELWVEFKFLLWHLLTIWLWTSLFLFGFFICKMSI